MSVSENGTLNTLLISPYLDSCKFWNGERFGDIVDRISTKNFGLGPVRPARHFMTVSDGLRYMSFHFIFSDSFVA